MRWPAVASLSIALALQAGRAHAVCDVIPGTQRTFRGALGVVDRPFARPGDPVELRLDPVCHGASAGFSAAASDHVVTVLFRPPAGPPSAVVLAPDCLGFAAARNRCEAGLGGGKATCIPDGDAVSVVERDGIRRLRVRFPDTDALIATPGDPASAADGRTLAGPAVIAVTRPGDDLPCGLATGRCRDTFGLVACVDELYLEDGACDDVLHPDFASFTALPPANDFGALCTEPRPPCIGKLEDLEVRLAVDRAGNLLVPMDWRGVLVRRADVPVARLLRGTVTLEAFEGSGQPLRLEDDSLLGSYSLSGTRLPPIFTPQSDPSNGAGLTLFGTADAPEGVLRIARGRSCSGGDVPGRPCQTDAECPNGACGPGAFDFGSRVLGGVGPLVLHQDTCLGGSTPLASCSSGCSDGQCVRLDAVADDPVPLDGLNAADTGYAFVVSEGLLGEDRNGDGDDTDDVVQLVDERTGTLLPIGDGVATGRAVVRVHQPPFSRPAVVAAGDTVAFLEPEALQHGRDANGDGDLFDTILRVFRLSGGAALDATGGATLVADAAPVINGASVAVSRGRVFFRTPEAALARYTTKVVSLRQSGEPVTEPNLLGTTQVISADGRFVVFANYDDHVVDGDAHCEPPSLCTDVFLGDRDADGNGRFDEPDGYSVTRVSAAELRAPAVIGAVSADGRSVAFISSSATLVPGDTNRVPDAFVYDRATGGIERVSVDSNGNEANAGVIDEARALAISGDGRFVAFASNSFNLVAGDTNAASDIFVHDRLTHTTERVSVASGGGQADRGSFIPGLSGLGISADGRLVTFDSDATTLVADDRNGVRDVFVRDRVRGTTTRVSVGVRGEEANAGSRAPTIAPDGSAVAFMSAATNLVPGVTRGFIEIYVHDLASDATEIASIASDGTGANSSSSDPAFSGDGRFVAFTSPASTLVPDDDNGLQDVFVHDRLTGLTERVSLVADGSEVPPIRTNSQAVTPALTGDGRTAVFVHTEDLVPGVMRHRAMFAREPDPDDVAAGRGDDLSGDGVLDDTMLRVLEHDGTVRTVCPAAQVAVAGGAAAFLRPEAAGEAVGCPAGPHLNADDDATDLVVHLAQPDGSVLNLGLAATAVDLSPSWVVALVAEAAEGGVDRNGDGDADDLVAAVHPAAGPVTGWTDLHQAADAIAVRGDHVILVTPEAAQGADLNGDGDLDDRVIQIALAPGLPRSLGFAVEDFVASDSLVAFRVREAAQGGQDLDGDGDTDDDVLFVYDMRTDTLFPTGQAVTPCRLEACDPRLPYRPLVDTVRFLTLEAAQGSDLTGDDDLDDLVLQTFSVAATAPPATSRAASAGRTAFALRAPGGHRPRGALALLAAVGAGICSTSGTACATDDACGNGGRCIVPPGRCVADLGTRCRPGFPTDCEPDEFCGSDPDAPSTTTCHHAAEECSRDDDCVRGERCTGEGQQLQRLAAPLSADRRAGAALAATGRCVDRVSRAEGSACRSDAQCPAGAACRPDLLTAGLADRDGDELPDTVDVCPDVPDPAQTDTDHDGIGDACDRRTAGNGIREPGEDCDGADDAACPGECQPDATCRCSTELPSGVRVHLGHQRPRRDVSLRAVLPLGEYDGGSVAVRIDDAGGRAIASGGLTRVPAMADGRTWRAAAHGDGLRKVVIRRLRGSEFYRVTISAGRWLPRDAAPWARVTFTIGGKCFAYDRPRVPPTNPTLTTTTSTTTTTLATTTTSSTTTTTRPPAGECCEAHRMVLTSMEGGTFKLGELATFDLPANMRITLDVGPPDAACRHPVTIPVGGLEVPSFCLDLVPYTADIVPLGCSIGNALGRGTLWDGNAPEPRPDVHHEGDTSDGVCNPPGEPCTGGELAAAGNLLGTDAVTMGERVADPGLHMALEIPVAEISWNAGGPDRCPDPDGQKSPEDSVFSQNHTVLRLTTGRASAELADLNADECPADVSGDSAEGQAATGPCCQVGQQFRLVATDVEFTGRNFVGDVVRTITLPVEVTSCEPASGLSTCETLESGGRVVTLLTPGSDQAWGLVPVDGDRIVVAASANDAGGSKVALLRYTADGHLDASFGSDGSGVVWPVRTEYGEVGAAAPDGDGRVVVAGWLGDDPGTSRIGVLRVDADGALDGGFGVQGVAHTAVGSWSRADTVAVQPDGRIVVGGRASVGGEEFALVRYLPDGSLDPSFGIGGVVTTDFDGGRDRIRALGLMTDGRIIAAGTSGTDQEGVFALARYLPDGSLDPSFGTLGQVTTAIRPGGDEIRALTILNDGSILAGGFGIRTTDGFGGKDALLARYRSDGSLEPTFGIDGIVQLQVDGQDDEVGVMLSLPDGRVVVAGVRKRLQDRGVFGEPAPTRWEWFLARIDPSTAAFDPTFGTGGLVTTSFATPEDRLFALARMPDGRFVAGGDAVPPDYRIDIALARYLPEGKLDASFGGYCTWGAHGSP